MSKGHVVYERVGLLESKHEDSHERHWSLNYAAESMLFDCHMTKFPCMIYDIHYSFYKIWGSRGDHVSMKGGIQLTPICLFCSIYHDIQHLRYASIGPFTLPRLIFHQNFVLQTADC